MLPSNDLGNYNGIYYTEYLTFDSHNFVCKTHCHPGYEFYLYLGDKDMTYLIGDQSYVVKKYNLIFVNSHLYHRSLYQNNMVKRYLLMFKEECIDALSYKDELLSAMTEFSKHPVMVFNDYASQKIQQMMENLVPLSAEHQPTLTSAALGYFILTVKHYYEQQSAVETPDISKADSKIIGVIDYILKNYNQKITLDELAEHFFISKHYLCRSFRKVMNQSIVDYINEKRLVEAVNFLIHTDKSVLDIALEVGFSNTSHFNTMFKRHFHSTPHQYRKMMRTHP